MVLSTGKPAGSAVDVTALERPFEAAAKPLKNRKKPGRALDGRGEPITI
jgi:hypothetical protein